MKKDKRVGRIRKKLFGQSIDIYYPNNFIEYNN